MSTQKNSVMEFFNQIRHYICLGHHFQFLWTLLFARPRDIGYKQLYNSIASHQYLTKPQTDPDLENGVATNIL